MNARLPHPASGNAAVEIEDGAIKIDASLVGAGLRLEPQEVLNLVRSNAITSVCEHGIDDDAGRYRLTFFHKSRPLRLSSTAAYVSFGAPRLILETGE